MQNYANLFWRVKAPACCGGIMFAKSRSQITSPLLSCALQLFIVLQIHNFSLSRNTTLQATQPQRQQLTFLPESTDRKPCPCSKLSSSAPSTLKNCGIDVSMSRQTNRQSSTFRAPSRDTLKHRTSLYRSAGGGSHRHRGQRHSRSHRCRR